MRLLMRFETASSLCRKLIEPKFAVSIIAVVAFVIRLLPMRFKYLLGYDPYFHLAYIRYAMSHGWVNFFPYAHGPWGIQIKPHHPLGLWMTPADVYKVLHPFGVSLFNAFRITPVIFGVLTVVFLYFTVLMLYGKTEAFLSALFLSVSFGHIFRSMAGYYRGDNYMLFWYALSLLGISLALSLKGPRWERLRLAFYLLPGLFAGFASAFWQAYYPIFGLLLVNALLLSVGAFILRRDRYILDGLLLAVSLLLGVFIANWIGGRLGYGMLGENRWLDKKLAETMGFHFGIIKDAFLFIFLKYALVPSIVALLLLLIFSCFVRNKRIRLAVLGVTLLAIAVLFVKYYGTFGSFLSNLFPQAPITETQRTGLKDWWEAYGVSGFLIPLFFLRFRKPRGADFLLLGTLAVLLPMAFIWTRFLFIGSFAVAVMAGLGLVELYKLISRITASSKRVPERYLSLALILIFVSLPVASAYQGTSRVLSVEPFMNEHWEKALVYLGEHSNINDVVLTWWDQGHWVTYYAMRAPVAQGGPSKWVAQYYLGLKGEKDLMKLGVDYVIVSYDTVLKFGAVLKTAGVSPSQYILIPLGWSGAYGSMLVFSNGPYSLMAIPGREWNVKLNVGDRVLTPKEVFIEGRNGLHRVPLSGVSNADVYAYINLNYGYAVVMNRKAFNTPLARLMFTDNYSPDYQLFYSDGGMVKIFRFVHPNVIVTSQSGSVVLKFTNATGTGLGIYGFLDNGTLVYKKWFGVKGKSEFILPENLNGSVVVRYVYVQKKTVLDRGVFRISDVLGGLSH